MSSVNFRGPYILSNSHLVQSRNSSFKLYAVGGDVGVIECLLSTSDSDDGEDGDSDDVQGDDVDLGGVCVGRGGGGGGGLNWCGDECVRGVSILLRILLSGSIIELNVLFISDSVSNRPVFNASYFFLIFILA